MSKWRAPALALALSGLAQAANAESLVLYCGAQEDWCKAMTSAFTKATGIDVAMTRKSGGETLAQIRAETRNPKGDVWWGGTGDPHLQAAEEGLSESYVSPRQSELRPWALMPAKQTDDKTIGIYAGALGVVYNTEVLARKKLPAPACWADLIKPEYKGEIQIANPNSSGTAYTTFATVIQLFGEEPAFKYLAQLHANVNQYTKSGAAPATATGRGETAIGIVFMDDAVTQGMNGFPTKAFAPCEGTGYEIGSMSLIKGGPNPAAARKWYDWALSEEAQRIGPETKTSLQVPSNAKAPLAKEAPGIESVKLIDYDFKKYGSAQERTRILARWTSEIGAK
ncbi:MAG: iron ABC transporter substrate-binding protein [Chelatococcus sp.]|nr:MAG: iron ABC transporter substrate-binding protein [Chelatococcus sp.]